MEIMTRSGRAVGSEATKYDAMIESKGKSKVINAEEIPEEVKVDDPKVVEAKIEGDNPVNENYASLKVVATPTNLKFPLKIPPPFP